MGSNKLNLQPINPRNSMPEETNAATEATLLRLERAIQMMHEQMMAANPAASLPNPLADPDPEAPE